MRVLRAVRNQPCSSALVFALPLMHLALGPAAGPIRQSGPLGHALSGGAFVWATLPRRRMPNERSLVSVRQKRTLRLGDVCTGKLTVYGHKQRLKFALAAEHKKPGRSPQPRLTGQTAMM
jgi:hypothetical protein